MGKYQHPLPFFRNRSIVTVHRMTGKKKGAAAYEVSV